MRIATSAFFSDALQCSVGTANYNGFSTILRKQLAHLPFIFHMQWAPHFLIGVLVSQCTRRAGRTVVLAAMFAVAVLTAAVQLGLYSHHGGRGLILFLGFYAAVLTGGFSLILSNRREFGIGRFRFTDRDDRALPHKLHRRTVNDVAAMDDIGRE